jgi:hypothetical protein
MQRTHGGMTPTVLDDPVGRLARDAFPFLRPPSTRRERHALPGRPPLVRQRLLGPPRGEDPAAWPRVPEGIQLTFAGDIVPVLIDPGHRLYRVVGEGSYPNGPFWTLDRPSDEDTMRRDYAVLNDWNGDHGLVTLDLVRRVAAWRGKAGPQRSSDRRGYLPGGAEQLWVPSGALGRSDGSWTIEPL